MYFFVFFFVVPVILVGTKKDKRTRNDYIHKEIKQSERAKCKKDITGTQSVPDECITEEEGKIMSENIGAYAYLECSASTKEGITEVFHRAIEAAQYYNLGNIEPSVSVPDTASPNFQRKSKRHRKRKRWLRLICCSHQ